MTDYSFADVLRAEEADPARARKSKWDSRMLVIAAMVAHWSKDPNKKVGAVIADTSHRIVSTGYNGLPRGLPDEDLDNRDSKLSRTVHAEMNALLNARGDVAGCTLYVTPLWPCDRCAVHIIQAGIARVVVRKLADHERWKDAAELGASYFRQAGVLYEII